MSDHFSKKGLYNFMNVDNSARVGKSNRGCRLDGRICTAQGGECRHNAKYYTGYLDDEQSWKLPSADESCPSKGCCFLE